MDDEVAASRERALALIERVDASLSPLFEIEEWESRRPDPMNVCAWRAWLAEFPE